MSKRAENAALKAYPDDLSETITEQRKVMIKAYRHMYQDAYEQAEKDILSIIQARLEEIQGDAQPRPILRAELQELMIKIMEGEK